ncbi:TPA: site-specific integrase [Vibrio vulnificus]|nr:site-specific integrase [Vibrio vulnificus]
MKNQHRNLRSQSARYFKSQIALGQSRKNSKRSDNTSPGIHGVRTLTEHVYALAYAASLMGISRLKHISEEHAVYYLLNRFKSGLSAKGIARDRGALERLIGRKLPTYIELHKLNDSLNYKAPSKSKESNQHYDPKKIRESLRHWREIVRSSISTKRLVTQTNELRKNLKDISRAYTDEQVRRVALSFDQEKSRLAVLLCRDAGLRVSELAELRRVGEGKSISNQRDWRSDRHALRKDSVEYIVTGKGGLVRSVRISRELALRLEKLRLNEPRLVTDRGVNYLQRYDLTFGNNLSKQFTNHANVEIGGSKGAHGLRHSFAHHRMEKLISNGFSYNNALHIVSQEMGHMRYSITKVYLR